MDLYQNVMRNQLTLGLTGKVLRYDCCTQSVEGVMLVFLMPSGTDCRVLPTEWHATAEAGYLAYLFAMVSHSQ